MLKVLFSNMLVLLSVFLCLSVDAQTTLPATIEKSTHLSINDSPYIISSSCTVTSSATLTVEAGVQFLLGQNASFINNGRCVFQGDENNTIQFTAQNSGENWRYILNYGTFIADFVSSKNAIRFISCSGDSLILKNCRVSETTGAIGDDCISAHGTKLIIIDNCQLIGDPTSSRIDAIDLDGVNNVRIENCIISNFPDDAIDIGNSSSNVQILGNTISNCDMGVSVGESSTVTVNKNLITWCNAGIQSHTKAVVTADQNTFFETKIGIRALHYDSQPTSYGMVYVSNSIFSNCLVASKLVENSVVTFDYCLSDGEALTGTNNIFGDAGFVDSGNGDFHLNSSSAAINAGDVNSTDVDGSQLDLGFYSRFNAPLIINEISPSNLSINADEANEYDDWVELLNTTDQSINLNGYYFSDNADEPLKGQISADVILKSGETLLLWADDSVLQGNTHLPFGLSGGGEFLSITNPDLEIVDSISFPVVQVNHTFGRHTEGRNWVYYDIPTPNAQNNGVSYSEMAGGVEFSHNGGAYSAATVSLESILFNESIKYSTNGNDPVLGDIFTNPLSVSAITTVRAVSQPENKLPGFKQSRLFYHPNSSTIPVLSLSMNNDDLYGEKGIYTNYKSSGIFWERPVTLSYYDETFQWAANAGVRIQGGNSVFMPKKAFRLFFRHGYGTDKLRTSPFMSGPSSFENLVLRSGYDDDITISDGTLLRDPFSAEIWKKMGEEATESDFVTLYLNNKYWGVYNLRESINEAFVMSHLNTKKFDLIRFLKGGELLKYGQRDSWNTMMNYFNTTDFTQPGVYEEVATFMDMNSTLNLLAFVHCSAFRSWTWGTFGIKPTNGKWTWTIWDTDRGFALSNWNGFTQYAITSAEKWSNIIPQKLIQNEQFRHALINRNCDLLNTLFVVNTAILMFDSLAAVIAPEIEREFERWNTGNAGTWNSRLDNIRNFLTARPNIVYAQMQDYFSIPDTSHIRIRIEGNGEVLLNSIRLNTASFKGVYMQEIPINLLAVPRKGAKFVGWKNIHSELSLSINPEDYSEIIAVFIDDDDSNTYEALVINEIMYHPANDDGGEWIEIYNPNTVTIDLSGWMISDNGTENEFAFPDGTEIQPENYLVIAGDLDDFSIPYPEIENAVGSFNKGISGFNLSNSGETIYLYNVNGVEEDWVAYMDISPWPEAADGEGASLQLRDPKLDNIVPENWGIGGNIQTTPGVSNLVLPTALNTTDNMDELSVYPNPTRGGISYLKLNNATPITMIVSLFDITGSVLFKGTIEHPGNGSYPINWNKSSIKPGSYVMQIQYKVDTIEKTESKLLIID